MLALSKASLVLIPTDYVTSVICNSTLFFRVLNSTAVSGVTSPLEENELASFRFIVVNIDGTDVFSDVLFQYVEPRLTSVPENQVIEA